MLRRPGRTAKVGPREVLAIREDYATGKYSQPDLARKYGIGPGQIGKIVRGEAWMELTAGNPVTTDGEAQLRMLTTPGPTKEEIEASQARLMAMLAKDVEKDRERESVYDLPMFNSGMTLSEMNKLADERRAVSGPPPEATKVRYPTQHNPQGDVDGGLQRAEQLLETLKDETQETRD